MKTEKTDAVDLQELAKQWVAAQRGAAKSRQDLKDAEAKKNADANKAADLTEALKKRCASRLKPDNGDVNILVDTAKAGIVRVEKGRVVELEPVAVIGLPGNDSPEKG